MKHFHICSCLHVSATETSIYVSDIRVCAYIIKDILAHMCVWMLHGIVCVMNKTAHTVTHICVYINNVMKGTEACMMDTCFSGNLLVLTHSNMHTDARMKLYGAQLSCFFYSHVFRIGMCFKILC